MAVDRRTASSLSGEAVSIYAEAERRLLQLVASRLRRGMDSPMWAQDKLAELSQLRTRAAQVMAQAHMEGSEAILSATERAWLAGAGAADDDLLLIDGVPDADPRATERKVQQLARASLAGLDALGESTTRTLLGTYQQAISAATAGSTTGAATRLDDAQQALDTLAGRGVGTLRDRAGRRWELPSYVEMATRTTTTRAAVAGTMDRLDEAGLDLVMVSDSSRECELCRPWEGKVLSRSSGRTGRIRARSARTGELVRVDVAGTVDEAMRDGLLHPSCTHNLSAYIPGATRRPRNTENPEGAAERAELRYRERKVREWKRREALALSPEAERKARAKVRDWQGSIRSHVDETGLNRKRNREQLGRAR